MHEQTQAATAVSPSKSSFFRRKWVWFLALLALLLLAWLGVKSYRIYTAVQNLLAYQEQVEPLLAGGLTQLDADQAEAMVLDVRQQIVVLKRETAVFMPLTPALTSLPKVGPLLAQAPQLVQMADSGSQTAVYLLQGLKPGLTILQTEQGDDQLAALVDVLADAQPELLAAQTSFAQFMTAYDQLGDTSAWPWRAQQWLEKAEPLLPLAEDALTIAPVLAQMMGGDGERTYLIIAQNEDELRPTGGFISGAGLLQLANGRIVNLSFQDANTVDNWQEKPYDFPPQPYYDLMGLELFLYRDANYWPDFPTSAEKAMFLYSYGQDMPHLDGAIAIDQQFIRYLLQGLGPVVLPESGETVTHQNVLTHFQAAWAKSDEQRLDDWHNERKSFMGTFGQAVQSKISQGLGQLDPLLLLQSLHTAVQSKHIQLYMRDEAVAVVLDQLDWDGRLQNNAGQDVLAIIDTNVGYNKVNMFVERALFYQVTLNDHGRHQAELSVQYHNNAPFEPGETGCYQDTMEDYGKAPAYIELADECYWNYMRVYTPADSHLISSTIHTVPLETQLNGQDWHQSAQMVNEFAGWQTFANFLMVPQQETVNSSLKYSLPETVIKAEGEELVYRLWVHQQAGLKAQQVQVELQLPPGATAVATTPSAKQTGQTVLFTFSLEKDTLLTVRYQP